MIATTLVFATIILVGWRLLNFTAHATRYLDHMRRYPNARHWPNGRTLVWRCTR